MVYSKSRIKNNSHIEIDNDLHIYTLIEIWVFLKLVDARKYFSSGFQDGFRAPF